MTSLREMLENGETEQVIENETPVEGVVEETVDTNGDLNTQPEQQTTPAPTPPARLGFEDRAEDMGLMPIGEGCFKYQDEFCEVAYRTLHTKGGAGIFDNHQVSQIAIFTKPLDPDTEWNNIGLISNYYKFVGNGDLIGSIRQSLQDMASTILNEETTFSSNLSQIRHEITIQNATSIPNVGDIYPQIVVTNSYDGTKAANITFGLFFNDGNDDIRFGSPKKFGSIRQIHMAGASTGVSSAVGEYVNVFSQNIGDLIQENFNKHITEDEMMKTLKYIEKSVGKKRHEALNEVLNEIRPEEGIESWSMTSWQLFHAITKYSTRVKNLNAKILIESAAERVLVVPEQMANALNAIS